MSNDVFFYIIEIYMKSNNINTALFMLNSYLINYYSTEIIFSKEILAKVVNLYKMSKRQEIIFQVVYEGEKQIEIARK